MKAFFRSQRLRRIGRALVILGLFFAPGDRLISPYESASAQVSNVGGSSGQPAGATYANQNQDFIQAGIQSFVKTYKYSSLGNTPAATPTDIFTITGSATKTIRISKIVVGGMATSNTGDLNPLLIRRSAADLTGTSTAPTGLPRDTNNSVATATLALYTANPGTLGTTVGTLDSCRLSLQPITAIPDVCVFSGGTSNDQMTVLRGTSDVLAINFAGAAVPAGGLIDLDVEWTEEP